MERCLHPRVYGRKVFPCGKCPACLSRNKDEFAQRLYLEAVTSRSAYFVTLTYDEENLPFAENEVNCFDKEGVRVWLRSLKDFLRTKNIQLRHFITAEYGDQGFRSHYHALLFFGDFLSLQQVYILCSDKWKKGLVYVSSVGVGCAKYCAKYCLKDDGTDELPRNHPQKPFRLYSTRPGLGCLPEALKYYHDNFWLTARKIDWKKREMTGNPMFTMKVPRTIRMHLSKIDQLAMKAAGWSKYFGYLPELDKSLQDPGLNTWDPVRGEFVPDFTKDLQIMEKTRKLRRLKKNCL